MRMQSTQMMESKKSSNFNALKNLFVYEGEREREKETPPRGGGKVVYIKNTLSRAT